MPTYALLAGIHTIAPININMGMFKGLRRLGGGCRPSRVVAQFLLKKRVMVLPEAKLCLLVLKAVLNDWGNRNMIGIALLPWREERNIL